MKKLIKLVLIIAIYCTFNITNAIVIKRETLNGGRNGYSSTSRARCSSTSPDGTVTNGYCISCSNPGRETCPVAIIKQPTDPSDLPDQTDVNQGNLGIQHALNAIVSGTLNGTHNYSFTDNNGFVRNYVLTWAYSEDANGENINSLMQVDRIN